MPACTCSAARVPECLTALPLCLCPPQINSVTLPPRASPKVLHVTIDASEVPSDYILAILSQCSTFPARLIFFLKGHLTVRAMGVSQGLACRIAVATGHGVRQRGREGGQAPVAVGAVNDAVPVLESPSCSQAHYLMMKQNLATIDTYFMIDCRSGGEPPSLVSSAQLPQQQPPGAGGSGSHAEPAGVLLAPGG